MALAEIRELLRTIPQVDEIPPMRDFLARAVERPTACWTFAPWACRSVGGRAEDALPAAAAIFCMLAAIHLVDDVLDEDPDGLYRTIGAGRAANMALCLQAAASRVVGRAKLDPLDPMVELDLQRWIALAGMDTARAQDQDLVPCETEEQYWNTVDAKTPPLFRCALAMGARVGGASTETAEAVSQLGNELGRLIQVSDDLRDALTTPASADWARPGNNLALLYASVAPHEQREAFLERLPRARDSAAALAEAQAMLFPSGAGSYCVHHMVEAYRRGVQRLESLELAEPRALRGLLDAALAPVAGLLERAGVDDAAQVLRAACERA